MRDHTARITGDDDTAGGLDTEEVISEELDTDTAGVSDTAGVRDV